jgi:HK97 family phage major capsid protein
MDFIEKKQEDFEKMDELEKVQYLAVFQKVELEKIAKKNAELEKKISENEANLNGLQKIVKDISISTEGKEKEEENTIKVLEKGFAKIKDEAIRVKATSTTQTAVVSRSMNHRLDGVQHLPSPKFVFTDFFPTIRVSNPNSFNEISYMDWDETSIVRAAQSRAENGTIAESELVLIEKTVKLESFADSVSLTKSAQKNADIFARDVNAFLENNMKRAINLALYSGNGVSPNIMGLYTRAITFNHAAYTGAKFINANLSDLLLVLKTRILKGKDQDYLPDFAFVTHDDYMSMMALKTATAEYINAPLHGINLIPSSFVTDNTMVLGCSNLFKIYTTLDYEYEIGYKTGNFEKRAPSVVIETVLQSLIREADLSGFLKVTDVAAALLAIKA